MDQQRAKMGQGSGCFAQEKERHALSSAARIAAETDLQKHRQKRTAELEMQAELVPEQQDDAGCCCSFGFVVPCTCPAHVLPLVPASNLLLNNSMAPLKVSLAECLPLTFAGQFPCRIATQHE